MPLTCSFRASGCRAPPPGAKSYRHAIGTTPARFAGVPARRRNFGTARKLSSGRWQARYWEAGEQRAAPETFATKADASAWLATAQTDQRRGVWIDPAAGNLTLSTYAQNWLTGRHDLRITTRGKYTHLLADHILPAVGKRDLAKLAPSDVRHWYQALAKEHQTTADDAYRLLRAIINTAVADNLILHSPCQVKGAGQVRSPERPIASVAEVTKAVEVMPERYRLPMCQDGVRRPK
jgi:hypothetical protein